MSEDAIKIFYSYSRKDLDMRNALEDHLSALREAKRIETWHDLQLEAGTEWEPAILHKLDTADIILLLISSSFIASKYCYGTELKRAIARHDAGTARVIPIILRPCDWNHDYVPFSKLNVLPTHAQPITKWEDRDEAFAIVARHIRETVDQLNANELASEKGVDYTRLRDLLKAGQWKEADQETAIRMFEVVGQQQRGWLMIDDVQNFPCVDLRTIDKLWVKHSQGRFGFSVQKRIWQKCNTPNKYYSDLNMFWEDFGEAVGWSEGYAKDWKSTSQFTFNTSAPEGHLPSYECLGVWTSPWEPLFNSFDGTYSGEYREILPWDCFPTLFSRVETCKL